MTITTTIPPGEDLECQAALSEESIARAQAVTGRSCGSCSMCCKLLGIPELNKPGNQWCQHCRPGDGGCTIYADRPPICRSFACVWLVDPAIGEEWQPMRSRIVVSFERDANGPLCHFLVDPSVPDRWRSEPYYSRIRAIALNGLRGADHKYFRSFVRVGKRTFLVLPNKDVDITGNTNFIITQPTPDSWDAHVFASKEDCDRFVRATAW